MKKIIFLLFLFSLANFLLSYAAVEPGPGGGGGQTSSGPSLAGGFIKCQNDPCTVQDLLNSIPEFMKFLIFISFWAALIISVIGAFLWMFGGPFPNLAQRGKNMIKTSIIGFILVVSSAAIFLAVLNIFSPKLRYPQN
ncbi:MAG: hypothetical protein C4348_00120 [Patescibacteria group bacterium]